ncbi:MAG: radical SAM protein [Bacillota bacterium]|nr:radical SAM protein [Bacillota bacterium]
MDIKDESLLALQQEAWMLREKFFPASIQFDYPEATEVISITGTDCALNCAHCDGHYLKNMTPINKVGMTNKKYTSCLISGGCDKSGKVPIDGAWQQMAKLKTNRKMNLHVGLVSEAEAATLPQVCDVVSFDFVADNDTIKEVYGLEKTVEDYINCFRALRKYVKVLPHICIGLKGGEIAGEYKALEIMQEENPDGIVFIVFNPTKNTRYADRTPPPLEDVIKIMATARKMFPEKPIHLGCMRPKGQYRAQLDSWAIKTGVNKIVVPTSNAQKLATELGLTIQKGQECCVL